MQAKHTIRTLLAVSATLLLHACSSDSDYDFEQGIANQLARHEADTAEMDAAIAAATPTEVLFDPSDGVLPFPNSLLFSGSTDGTINVPVADPTDPSAAATLALNQMDGFSTTAPLVAQVSRPVNPATLIVGTTVRVFEVTTADSGAVSGVVGELGPTEVFATASGTAIAILPLQPLNEKTDYMVVLTDGITDEAGDALQAGVLFNLVKGSTPFERASAALEPVRLLTGSMLLAAAGAAPEITAESVVMTWTFKTQSIRDVLQAVEDQTVASPLTVAPTGMNTTAFNPALPGSADVYIGTLDLPYYQTAPGGGVSAEDALNAFAPEATSTVTVPVMMTVPNADAAGGGDAPAAGWPVTIFQHGITQNRTNVLAIADAMANAGIAVIAIDLPLHGVTDPMSPVSADSSPFPNDRERTFGTTTVESDGMPDYSGFHFYNPARLPAARDNARQAIADLLVLSASISGLQGAPVDASRKTFIGHSLGGIMGTTFLAYDDSVTAASLVAPGGGIARLLSNSGSFGPILNAGLAASGAPPGSAAYEQFLTVAQTVVDSADPINHAATLASANSTSIHMVQILDDGTVPNSVATAPLSGTLPLAAQLGLQQISSDAAGGSLVVLTEGAHGSLLTTDPSPAATVEIQTEVATFAASNGTLLPIANPAIVQAAP